VKVELVDVGDGTSSADYDGKNVKGKIVLATGNPSAVHALAVWGKGAAVFVWFRTLDHEQRPDLISGAPLFPFTAARRTAWFRFLARTRLETGCAHSFSCDSVSSSRRP
jgi:hypothetical protein